MHFIVALHAVQLVLNHCRRIVELRELHQFVKHTGDVRLRGDGRLLFFHRGGHLGAVCLECLHFGIEQLCKGVIQRRRFIALNLLDIDGEGGLLAGMNALAFGRPGEDEFLRRALLHAKQRRVEAGRIHGILGVGRHVPIGLVEHSHGLVAFGCGRNDALHVNRQHVAIGAGAVNLLPGCVLTAQGFKPLVNRRVINLGHGDFHAQRTIVAQIHGRLQRHNQREDQRVHAHILERGNGIGLDLLLLKRFFVNLLTQFVHELAIEVGKAKLLDDDVIGRLALAETGQAVLAGDLGCGLAQFLIHAFLRNLDLDL